LAAAVLAGPVVPAQAFRTEAQAPAMAPGAAPLVQGAGQRLAADPGTDRLIIKYRSGAGLATERAQAALRVAANRQGLQMGLLRHMASGAQVLRTSRRMSQEEAWLVARSLRDGDPAIEYAEPDLLLKPALVPNDALLAQQWAWSDATGGVRAPAAWDRSTGAGIVVAVIDTGVRAHADLAANLLPGYDFITDTFVSGDNNGRDADASDPGDAVTAGYCGAGAPASNSSWHGTHVAGIVAAVANNASGVAGLAYQAKVLPLRVLGRCGGYSSDIADAIVWAAGGTVSGVPANPNPARVINLSLGGSGSCGLATQNAINTARARGAVVVVAAGNDNANASTATPANCTGVVTVAATGKSGGKASYSNTGANVSLAAPGGDAGAGILSTLNAGSTQPGADNYVAYMGTSMATPVVSATAALVLAAKPALTPDQVAALLKSTARAFPAACSGCGTGIVDAGAAVAQAAGSTSAPPAPSPAPAPSTPPTLNVADKEPNSSFGTAQALASVPAVIAGSITSNDNDYYRFSVPAGRKVVATLTMGSSSAFGLALYSAGGSVLAQVGGSAGLTRQLTITNSGSTPVALVLRVWRTAGNNGNYQLALALP
jgi:serine protease